MKSRDSRSAIGARLPRWAKILLFASVPLGCACCSCLFFVGPLGPIVRPMGTMEYRPSPGMEAAAYAATIRDVHPNDVHVGDAPRAVAWAGIVRAFDTIEDDNGFALRLVLEHRFFDWLEDHGAQREIYWVSPRGEGTFETCWWMPSDWRAGILDMTHEGDLFLVYGAATRMSAGLALVPPRYVKAMAPELWRDDVYDYGREGEPTRSLRTPMPFDATVRAPLTPLPPGTAPTVTGPCRADPPPPPGHPLAPTP